MFSQLCPIFASLSLSFCFIILTALNTMCRGLEASLLFCLSSSQCWGWGPINPRFFKYQTSVPACWKQHNSTSRGKKKTSHLKGKDTSFFFFFIYKAVVNGTKFPAGYAYPTLLKVQMHFGSTIKLTTKENVTKGWPK